MKWAAILALVASPLFAQTRIASDFEIAQMKQQIATSHDFLSQLSGHLNLGDLYLTRSETSTARAEYAQALEIAGKEAIAARRGSDITRYATATAYAALAHAKLGHDVAAFAAAEEAIRYTSGSAKSWNLYSTAMTLLGKPLKASSAARNAFEIARHDVEHSPSVASRLDLALYEYTLASALIDAGDGDRAQRILRDVMTTLRSDEFEGLRRDVARHELFEIYSSARGDDAAYLSLWNRAGLRLGALLEARGDRTGAQQAYVNVLEFRTDDPTALAALARMSKTEEQDPYFSAAFDANPFSMELIHQYRLTLRASTVVPDGDSTGARVRAALIEMHRGEMHAAREKLDSLLQQFPDNDTLRALRRETVLSTTVPAFLDAADTNVAPAPFELRQLLGLLQSDKLSADQRAALDRLTFTNAVHFDSAAQNNGQTILESGSIGDVRFRFSEPTAFTGALATDATLTYRILGATESGGADALLLEPVRIGK